MKVLCSLARIRSIQYCMQNDQLPRNRQDHFLGLVGFYRQFIKNFSELAAPLTELTKKGQRNQDIKWGESQEKAFNQLRQALVSKPILKMVEISKAFTLQVDASDLGIGAIVLQEKMARKYQLHTLAGNSNKAKDHTRSLKKSV